jgi:putative transposase
VSEADATLCVMRFRLYPSAAQEVLLLGHCGHARFVWNLGLEQRLMWRRWQGPTPGFNAQAGQLTEARRAESWLACGSQTVQQQALRDLDQAWRRFFAGTHKRPTWRKAGEDEGLRIVGPQAVRVRQDNGARSSVLVPKIGWVWFKRSRALACWKSYRITRDGAGRWHIAFAVIPDPIAAPGKGEVVGVDRGVTVAVALSTGEMTSPAGLSLKEAERLLRLQRRLARRGSNRRRKVRTLIGGLKSRDGDRRKDWVQKTTTGLARHFEVIRVENLNVKGMTRSARGTMEKPGRKVAQKAGLNRGILKSGWGLLVTRLEQKATGRVEKVKAAYTSQTCNACEHIAAESRKSQATFVCVACGHRANADVNAARNIAAGHAVAARGDRRVLARSVKREPQHARPPKVA